MKLDSKLQALFVPLVLIFTISFFSGCSGSSGGSSDADDINDGDNGGSVAYISEDFSGGVPGGFTGYDAGDTSFTWKSADYGDAPCAAMSAYGDSYYADEDWLISPEMDFSSAVAPLLTFSEAINYDYGNGIENFCTVVYSTNYSGSGDPGNATWTKLSVDGRTPGNTWDFFDAAADLSDAKGAQSVYVAFKYVSTTACAPTWEIDNIKIDENASERIAASPYTVNLESVYQGTASNSQSVTVKGYNLNSNIIVTIEDSANFEISVDSGSTWDSSAVISQSNGTADGTVEVRIKEAATDTGTLTTTLGFAVGSASQTVAVAGFINSSSGVSSLTENFSNSVPGSFTVYDAGNTSYAWQSGNYGDAPCAVMTAYNYDSGYYADEDWLISPKLNFSSASAPELTYIEAIHYAYGEQETYCQILYSTDYSGSGDPNNATWTELAADQRGTGNSWDFVDVTVDLSDLAGESSAFVAFKYTSTSSLACTWELDTIEIKDNTAGRIYVFGGTSVSLNTAEGTASDAISRTVKGVNITNDLSVSISDSTNFEISVDGGSTWDSSATIPHSSGTAGGTVAVRIKDSASAGSQSATITLSSGSVSSTISVSGMVVDSSGLTSLSTEFTEVPGIFSIYDAGNTSFAWVADTYGDDGACATMSAYDYDSGYHADEDWLITPKMNFSSIPTPELTFSEAINYAYGNQEEYCKILCSTDYSGSGNPNSATWTELTADQRGSGDSWDFIDATVDLSGLGGESSVYIAFKYTSISSASCTWEIDWIKIQENTASKFYVSDKSVSLSTDEGTASDAESITVTAVNISSNVSVSISDSTNFEISVDGGSSWGSSATITQSSGVASGTVDVRLKASATSDSPNAVITLSSGSLTATVSVSGTVVLDSGITSLSTEFTSVPDLFTIYEKGISSSTWRHNTYGDDNHCAYSNAYSGGAQADEDWLITPKMNFSSLSSPVFKFSEAINYGNSSAVSSGCKILYSTDYSGSGDPDSATWTELGTNTRSSGSSWTFVDVTVDVSSLTGQSSVYFAFQYISTTSACVAWEIDWVEIGE